MAHKISFIVTPLLVIVLMAATWSCHQAAKESVVNMINWDSREASLARLDSLVTGATYLSVYSHIYSRTESRTHDLTATVSMKNISRTDSVFVTRASYYNTKGDLIRKYIDGPIYLLPLETLEIVIPEGDREGGSGANFVFDWKTKNGQPEPLFEAVMISTSGQQGISFTTQGVRMQ